jgi:signal transduction histidine kinase
LSRALGTAEQQRQAAARIDRSAQHIDKMLGDLLDVARTRLGDSLPLDRQPMDAGDVCARIVRDMRALYPNHDLNYESEGDLKGVWDAARLDQLLSNLVRNAIQHGDAASTVTLRSIGEPERVVFDVHNFGRPIPPSKLPHIFEPLVRGDEGSGAQGRSGSMGLGLYIASTIANAHRGTLTATSSLEHGTLFTARLPRTQEQRESTPAQGS